MVNRGMPSGKLLYEKDIVINQLSSSEFKTTSEILTGMNKLGIKKNFSWNTIQKYLTILSEDGKIESLRVGRYNFWKRIVIVNDVKSKA